MKKFVIKVEDIPLEAESFKEADNLAVDIVNDIAHDGAYTLEEVKE